ncbi:MAG: TolC family protein [Endozoicomonadaceae bacterium]|nr:TolC family protein [Endozoicomonadaceae bacterium]
MFYSVFFRVSLCVFFEMYCVLSDAKIKPVFDQVAALNLHQVYQLVQKNNALFSAEQAAYRASRMRLNQKKSAFLPHVTASLTSDYEMVSSTFLANEKKTNNRHVQSITLNQSLFDRVKWGEYQVSKLQEQSAQMTVALSEQQLMYDTANQYFKILKAKMLAELKQHDLSTVRKHLGDIKKSHQTGSLSESDLSSAEREYANARVQMLDANDEVDCAVNALSMLAHQHISVLYQLNPMMPIKLDDSYDMDYWMKKTNQNNVEIKKAALDLSVSKKRHTIAALPFFPVLSAQISLYRHINNPLTAMSQSNKNSYYWLAGLSLKIPLYTGGYTSSVKYEKRYLMEEQASRLSYQTAKATITLQNIWNALYKNEQKIEAYRMHVMSAKKSLKVTQAYYAEGAITLLDVFKQESIVYDAYKTYWCERYDLLLNYLKLKKISGILSESDLKKMSQWLTPEVKSLSDMAFIFHETEVDVNKNQLDP